MDDDAYGTVRICTYAVRRESESSVVVSCNLMVHYVYGRRSDSS